MLINLNKNSSVLVIHTANMGDVISGSIVIEALKTQCSKIDVLIRKTFCGLFSGDSQIIEIYELGQREYDLVIDLDSTGISRPHVKNVTSTIKIGVYNNTFKKWKQKFLFTHQAEKHKYGHIVEDYFPVLDLLELERIKRPRIYSSENGPAINWLKENNLEKNKYVAMHFSSSNPIRQMPDKLIHQIIAPIRKSGLKLVFVGVEEKEIKRVISKLDGYPISKPFSISELKTIIENSLYFVGSDSGPMHLATAMNKKGLAFYGPTLAKNYGYISDKIKTIEKDFDCRPCNQNIPCPFNHRCLNSISDQMIQNHLKDLSPYLQKEIHQ